MTQNLKTGTSVVEQRQWSNVNVTLSYHYEDGECEASWLMHLRSESGMLSWTFVLRSDGEILM